MVGSVLILAGFQVEIAFSNLRDRADSVRTGSAENSREELTERSVFPPLHVIQTFLLERRQLTYGSAMLIPATPREFGVDVPRYPHFLVCPQLRNCVLEYICDESATLRFEEMADPCRTNLANGAMSSSRFWCPSVALVGI